VESEIVKIKLVELNLTESLSGKYIHGKIWIYSSDVYPHDKIDTGKELGRLELLNFLCLEGEDTKCFEFYGKDWDRGVQFMESAPMNILKKGELIKTKSWPVI